MLPFLSSPHSFPHMVNVCHMNLSLVMRVRFPSHLLLSSTFVFSSFFSSSKNLWLPSLILPCRFIRDLKIGMLCHMALMLHLLHLRFPTPSTPLLETNDLPIAYDKVNILVLNAQLEILCPIIMFHLVSPWLHSFACTMSSISIPSSYKLALLHLDGNMLWMRK